MCITCQCVLVVGICTMWQYTDFEEKKQEGFTGCLKCCDREWQMAINSSLTTMVRRSKCCNGGEEHVRQHHIHAN